MSDYDPEMKKRVLSLLATGHRHESMDDATKCDYCSVKFAKAKKEITRLMKTYPEKFVRKEVETPDIAMENMGDMLEERVKDDPLYREHLRLLAHGTPEEKAREIKRFQSGYYERHTGENTKKLFL